MERFPVYGMKVARSFEDQPSIEGHSYVLIEDAFVPTKTLVYGPVQDSALDQIWFLAMRIHKALDFDVEEYYLRCSEDEVEEAWDRYQKLTRNNNKRMLRGTAR